MLSCIDYDIFAFRFLCLRKIEFTNSINYVCISWPIPYQYHIRIWFLLMRTSTNAVIKFLNACSVLFYLYFNFIKWEINLYTQLKCKYLRFCVWSFSYIGNRIPITISVWNQKKIHKKARRRSWVRFASCSNSIQRLKDTGCKLNEFPSRFNANVYEGTLVNVII